MQFDSLAAALAMEGHGAYVWSVYLIAVLVVTFLLLGPVLRSRRILLERRGDLRREQAAKNKEVPLASGS
jgi:heme exporter protein D